MMIRRMDIIRRVWYLKRTIGRTAMRSNELKSIVSIRFDLQWWSSIGNFWRWKRTKFRWIVCGFAINRLALVLSHDMSENQLKTKVIREDELISAYETEEELVEGGLWEPKWSWAKIRWRIDEKAMKRKFVREKNSFFCFDTIIPNNILISFITKSLQV